MKIVKEGEEITIEQENEDDFYPCIHGLNIFSLTPCSQCETMNNDNDVENLKNKA